MAKTIVPGPVPSRSSTSESSTSLDSNAHSHPHHHTSHHGFRTQLGHLLPRHALFQVHLNIEELSNVPLVKGQFAVRWKFKNVQSGSGLLAKMKGSNNSNPSATTTAGGRSISGASDHSVATTEEDPKGKGKAKAGLGSSPYLQNAHLADTESEKSNSIYSSDRSSFDSHHLHHNHQNQHLSPWTHHPNSSESSSSLPQQQVGLTSPLTTPVPLSAAPVVTHAPRSPVALTPATPSNTATSAPDLIALTHSHVEPRGMTDWAELSSYNARWDQNINVVVQMDVHRETCDLLPSELKLVVVQRVIQGDPDAPRNPRLGAIYLNLAEYADAGSVTRRYLLRESKINATLKLTLSLTHIGGTNKYKPPPLRKSEIMAEVSGLLSNNDLLRTRLARTLDLYSRDELLPNARDGFEDGESTSNRAHARVPSTATSPRSRLLHSSSISGNARPYTDREGAVDFDRLASLNGLHTTETLIEAIFNPVPTTSERPSPFTYYAPDKPRAVSDPTFGGARGEGEDGSGRSQRSGRSYPNSNSNSSSNSNSNEEDNASGRASSTYARSELSSLSLNVGCDGIRTEDHSHSGTEASRSHWWKKSSNSRSKDSRLKAGPPSNPGNLGKRWFSTSTTRLPVEVE